MVLVIAVVALQHPTNSSTTAGTTAATHPETSSASHTAGASASATTKPSGAASTSASNSVSDQTLKAIPLVVLNNTTTTGLAYDATQLFQQAGWTVSSYGNYQNDIVSTCAYYDPSVPNAEAAAELLRAEFPSIVRVEPKFSGLQSGPIVVVLTPDFQTA